MSLISIVAEGILSMQFYFVLCILKFILAWLFPFCLQPIPTLRLQASPSQVVPSVSYQVVTSGGCGGQMLAVPTLRVSSSSSSKSHTDFSSVSDEVAPERAIREAWWWASETASKTTMCLQRLRVRSSDCADVRFPTRIKHRS